MSGMELISFLFVLAGIIGVAVIFDRLIRKWFAIDEEVLKSAPAKKIESWTRWTTVFALLCLFPLVDQDFDAYIFWLLLVLTTITAVEAFFEWKLLKGSRKYQMTLVSYVFGMLLIITMLSFR